MFIYNFDKKYVAKYITGTILRGMTGLELKPGHLGEYRICLKSYDDDIDSIWFYIPIECVEERHESLEDLSIVTYDANLPVNDKAIYKICLQEMTGLESDDGKLASYVHIDLRNVVYDVLYKNKQTRWKIKHMDVMRDDLKYDYIVANRAAYKNMSAKTYLEWLQKEKIDSSLFCENLEK